MQLVQFGGAGSLQASVSSSSAFEKGLYPEVSRPLQQDRFADGLLIVPVASVMTGIATLIASDRIAAVLRSR